MTSDAPSSTAIITDLDAGGYDDSTVTAVDVNGVRKLGVIRNPHSQRNRAREATDAKAPMFEGIEVLEIEPESQESIPQIVAEMHRSGVRHIVVDGGDGTLRDVMSALPQAYGNKLPTLTLFAGGNANLASVDVGNAGHGPDAMTALLRSLREPGAGLRTRRRPIEVHWPDGSHAPVLCFFVGAASFYHGWKLALGTVRERGFVHGAGVAVAMAGALWQTLLGGKRNRWQVGVPMDVSIDGGTAVEGQHFLFLASSLHRLYGSLWPFFNHADDAALSWLDIDAPPPRIGRALPGLLRGTPKDWVRNSPAYRSGGAECIQLRLETPLVVDGEPFTPGAYGIVELRAGPEIEFYTPTAPA